MDWHRELLHSLGWLFEASAISLIGLVIVGWFLVMYTEWGRHFWKLAHPYLNPRRSSVPLSIVVVMIVMRLFTVRMDVLFSYWYQGFYDALQKLDSASSWFHIELFAILATIHVGQTLLATFVGQAFEIHWRTELNTTLLSRWFDRQAYYLTHFLDKPEDNPDQRIQQDVTDFVSGSVALSIDLLGSVVSLVAFTQILWKLSAPLAVGGVVVPHAMVAMVFGYVVISTLLAFYIGRPLIKLNFLNEKLNANYRYALMRVREYAESIAFFQGEQIEQSVLKRHFATVIQNAWAIVYRSLKLSGFNLAISQAAVLFPFLVQLPRLLKKEILLGDVMQTGNAFGQVSDSLSFFRESYEKFAQYQATLNRLNGFIEAIDAVDIQSRLSIGRVEEQLEVSELNVNKPDGGVLVSDMSLTIPAGGSLLIKGSSGIGKTTLLRSIAGLWPNCTGKVARPVEEQALFLSQLPYLPLGSLLEVLYYPSQSGRIETAREVLIQCRLDHLVSQLEAICNWSRVLSQGEQQRLAFARILLNAPRIVFLDEATSAMDETLEADLYQLLRRQLPAMIVVSVGHHRSLEVFHAMVLTLWKEGKWQIESRHGTI